MTHPLSPLLLEIRQALGLTQGQFGDLLGIAKRTVQRWEDHGTILLPSHLETLTAALYPAHAALAATLAVYAGTTLTALGLERAPATAPLPPVAPPLPTATLVDSILCVAADAIGVAPRAIRPALAAAFARAREVRLDVGTVADSLADTTVEPRP